MSGAKDIVQIAEKIDGLSKEMESLIPQVLVKTTTAFGNSAHVVLSRNFLDKKVGIVILGEKNSEKGGAK